MSDCIPCPSRLWTPVYIIAAAAVTAATLYEIWRTKISYLTAEVLRLRTQCDYERHLADGDAFPQNPMRKPTLDW